MELTPEEESQFTPLNCFAFITMREQGIANDTVPAAWLCMSEDARQKARDVVIEMANKQAGVIVPIRAERLNKMLGGNDLVMRQLAEWKRFETELKAERANGNPRAFFIA